MGGLRPEMDEEKEVSFSDYYCSFFVSATNRPGGRRSALLDKPSVGPYL